MGYNCRVSTIRLRVRELRTALGLSQQALAERAGLYQATVSELESGRAKRADFATLERLASALGVLPGDLFEGGASVQAARQPAKKRP